ncbi:hypothetical protein I3760_09G152700 [Carya illinoinensis]|nr:hypothetical protein I3760_09G152700 [Carya illinoinensis]
MDLLELLLLLACFCLELGTATDTITTTKFISDAETLISSNGDFELGFFNPENSTYRYVGICKPLNCLSGILTISEDGNLVVLDEQKKIIWSSNITDSVFNSSAQLLDPGNLVLQENKNKTIMWESFQHPTDTFVPKMKLSTSVRTGKKVQGTSWTNYSREIPAMDSVFLDGFRLTDDEEGTLFDLAFAFLNESVLYNFFLNARGNIEQKISYNGGNWEVGWSALETECDVYGKGNWSNGCVRRTPLQCEGLTNEGEEGKKDRFLKLKMMKVPYFVDRSSTLEDECRDQCLKNCSCIAYAYDAGIGCMSWTRELIDSQLLAE